MSVTHILRGTATVALLCGALLVVPAGASANADVCQADSLRSYVCIKIFGSDRYVDHFEAVRSRWGSICNYRARIRVRGGGRTWNFRSRRHLGCSYGRAWFNFYVRRRFPNNSTACTFFYEGGVLQGAVPCARIYRS